MFLNVPPHSFHCFLKILCINLLEVIDELCHFLVVKCLNNSLEILFNINFDLPVGYYSLKPTEKIDLLVVYQVNYIESHAEIKFALVAQPLMVNHFVMLRLRELEAIAPILKHYLFVFKEERNFFNASSHGLIHYSVLGKVTNMGLFVTIYVVFIENYFWQTVSNCIVDFGVDTL